MHLTSEEIIKILKEYENDSKKQYAILIDGEWGSGKTHFIKKEYIKKDKNKIYASLYGVKNKDEINQKIYYSIIEKSISTEKNQKIISGFKKAGKAIKLTQKGVLKIAGQIFKMDLSLLENISINGIISMFKDIKHYILIFDDLERCDMPINEVLGYINEFVEHKDVKVIIIANEREINKINYDSNYELKMLSCLNNNIEFSESKISKGIFVSDNKDESENGKITINTLRNRIEQLYEGNKKYEIIKEKLIGYTIKYEPDISKIYDELIKEYEEDNKKLYMFLSQNKSDFTNIMEVNQCKNIRTVIFILDVFEKLYAGVLPEIKEEKVNRILNLVYRNTIFCVIGLKNGVKIERILNGCMCDTAATLKDDRRYNAERYFTAFDFVNDYIVTSKLDIEKVRKTLEYYQKLKFDDLSSDDPIYDLQTYWELEDNEIEEALIKIKENVENGIYDYRLFPKIIYYMSRIEKLNFKKELISEIVNRMIESLSGKKIEYIDFHEFVENEKVAEIYNRHVKDVKEKIEITNKIEDAKTIENALHSKNWGIEIHKYVTENKGKYLDNKCFLKDFEINEIVNNILESDSKNIYYFKYCLDTIYKYSNIKDYYLSDMENIKVLIDELDKMDKSKFGVTKKEAVEYLEEILKRILEKLI